jgi:hypothetical protein
MLTNPRTHWARTRLTPFCLTWGERVASRAATADVQLEEQNTSPHLRLEDDEKTVVRRAPGLEH